MSSLPEVKIDTKGLGEPLAKFVDCVSKGIGKVYEPIGTVRQARADAKAKLILADADDEIARRAAYRVAHIETGRQANIESICEQAKLCLPASVSSKPVSEDWIHQFFDECKDIGETQMQALWGHILAGEVAKPGTFSRRTLQLLRTFERKDAIAFSHYCSVVFSHSNGSHFAFSNAATTAALDQIASSAIESHLITIGLLAADTTFYGVSQANQLKARYFTEEFGFTLTPLLHISTIIERPEPGITLRFFTAVGEQLYSVISAKPIPGFLEKQAELFAQLHFGLQLAKAWPNYPSPTRQPSFD